MEAAAIKIMENTLVDHDRRLVANHDTLARLRDRSAAHDTKIEVITTELRETREDIADLRKTWERGREEQKAEGAASRRALYTVAGFMATFSLSLCGLIAVLLSHA